MKSRLFMLLVAALAGSAGAQTPATLDKPLPGDPLQTTIHRLSNGLTVYLTPYHQEPRIVAWIAVRAGAKNDPADSTGMAHYLEHMLFKGTSKIGTLDFKAEKPHLQRITALYEKLFRAAAPSERASIYKEIDAENIEASRYAAPGELAKAYREMGFRGVNAFTSEESTVFVCDMPANRAEAWAKVESERFSGPVFRLFQSELEAVYEEKNRSMDNPGRIFNEALNRKLFGEHPYGRTVLGSIEHLKNPSLAKMYAFYAKNYRPSNMAIILSGDFDREKMLGLIDRYFGAWQAQAPPEPEHWEVPKPTSTERVAVNYVAEEEVAIAWPTPPVRDSDEDAISVMDMVMDNASAGLINLHLNQAQKVKAAGSYPDAHNDASSWVLWAVPKKGQTLEQAEQLLLETADELKGGAFTDEDIRAVVTDFEIQQKRKFESNEGRVQEEAASYIQRRPWPETVQSLERLRRVTKADVLRVAQKYLGPGRVVAYRRNAKPEIADIAKPNFTKIKIDPARQSKFFKEVLDVPAPALEPHWLEEGRDYSETAAPFGKVVSARNPANDLFSLTLAFERGSRQERGLCAALNLLGFSGAGELSAEDFKRKLYQLGTALSYGCSEQQSSVNLSGLDANLEQSLSLMFERFDEPNVSTETLKKLVEVSLGAHQDNKKNPGAIYGALSQFALRGKDSPVLSELTDAEWQGLTLDGLKALIVHALDFKWRTAYVGNRKPSDIGRMLSAHRSALQAPPARVPLLLQRPAQDKVILVNRDMVQSQVGLFSADEAFDQAHVPDYQFYSSYLGGGMSSVIFQEIREARSLAYSANGGHSLGSHKGDENRVYGELGCQADKTAEAAGLMRELLTKPPLSEKRFAATAKTLEERYRTEPIFFRDIPQTVLWWEDLGLKSDPRPEEFKRTLAYRLKDLSAFAERFSKVPMTVYILGPRDRIGLEAIRRLGEVQEKTVDELFPY